MAATKKAKKVKVQQPRIRKNMLQDPSWVGAENWDGAKYSSAKHAARDYYNNNYGTSDLTDFTFQWMADQDRYTRQDIRAAKLAKANSVGPAVGIVARMLTMGMPDVHEAYNKWWLSLAGTGDKEPRPWSEYLHDRISLAIAEGKTYVEEAKAEEKAKANVYVPSIQERMRETCINMVDEIEEFLEAMITGLDPVAVQEFNPVNILRGKQAKPGHARIVRNWYIGGLEEHNELLKLPNAAQLKKMSDHDRDMVEQLKEGYAHLDAKEKKLWQTIYQKIIDACDIVEKESKIQRTPRKVKAKSPADLVKKLKFKNSDVDYGIASVTPDNLIGANIAFVFNCKTRKFGVYYASNVDPKGLMRAGSGFSVKGTTLVGYDESRSVQRTIRKPAEFLPQVKKTTRAKMEKTFATIKTTETKLNGRFNEDTIILAVF